MNPLDLRLFGKPPTGMHVSACTKTKRVFWKFGEIEVGIYKREDSRFGVALDIEQVEIFFCHYETAKDAITSAERSVRYLKESVDAAMQSLTPT